MKGQNTLERKLTEHIILDCTILGCITSCQNANRPGETKNIFLKISEKAFAAKGTATRSKQQFCESATEKSLKHLEEVFQINGQKPTKQIEC